MNKKEECGREENGETRRKRQWQDWHRLCELLPGMKPVYKDRRGRIRAETVASLILSIGIIAVAIVPAAGPWQALGFEGTLFTVTEGDYSSPLISSARAITILNLAAGGVATFAGYDDFATRVDVSNKANVASVTRYSGDLLKVLNVRCLKESGSHLSGPLIYISEGFWDRELARDENVLGRSLKIHNVTYAVAGVTREFRGMLAGTDIWLPVGGGDSRNLQEVPFMRIVGTLNSATSWKGAQRVLSRCFVQFVRDQTYNEREGAKLVPLQKVVGVAERLPILAGGTLTRSVAVGS